jgi:PAS domain S-box-containing protein
VPKTYDPVLVVLSVLIAVWASYDALILAGRISLADARTRPMWLAAGSLAMGIGVWSMHFLGMLALRLPVPVSYNIPLAVVSVLVAIAASAVAFALVSREILGRRWFVAAGVWMGLAIAGMHYTGMAAMRLPAMVRYDPRGVTFSIVIAIAGSLAALQLAFRAGSLPRAFDRWPKAAPAALLGLAVVGMHYTAMAAARFTPRPLPANWTSAAAVPATTELATLVALGTAAMLGMAHLGVLISRREEQLRFQAAVLENVGDVVVATDRDGCIIYWNKGASAVFGYSADEMLGEPPRGFLPPPAAVADRPDARPTGPPHPSEWQAKRKDGTPVWLDWKIATMHDAAGEAIGLVAAGKDVTERKRVEAELAQYRGQLRALAARIESAREDERTRIARELHDELGQALTVLKLDLGWLAANIPKRTALARKIRDMAEILEQTLDALRRLAGELRPPALDQLGLRAAIRVLAQEFEARTGVCCRVEVATENGTLDERLAAAVYRILQEAITNVARHARATQVDILLGVTPRDLALEVRDNGRGITERELADRASLGLLGMRERAQSWGGEVAITGTPGEGTRVHVTIPLGEGSERRMAG